MATIAPARYRWHVDGMDCPSCVRTIETALGKLPGVTAIRLSYGTGTLQAQLGSDEIAGRVERRLAQLGYRARQLRDGTANVSADVATEPSTVALAQDAPPWWAHPGLRPVAAIGGLILFAWMLSLAAPAWGTAAFTVAAILTVAPFARKAWARARAGSPFTIETLMVTAAIGAVFVGAASEAGVVILLFAVGDFLESVAADQARAGIRSLVASMPRTARRMTLHGVEEVTPEELRVGDLILVRPGDRVPADGTIREGTTHLDQSPLTGESVPVVRSEGEEVLAGSVNADGAIKVEVARASGDTTLARIGQLVADAQANKSPTERFIDRFSRWYTPAAIAAALIVAILPPLVSGAEWSIWIYRALALLLIACPCALVISTPAAIASGLAAGARRGLLVKGGAALEMLARIRQVAFDKTGTLTVGRPVVTDTVSLGDWSDRQLLACAASIEVGSAHPIARAIHQAAEAAGLTLRPAREHRVLPGKGVSAIVQGRPMVLVAPRFADEMAVLPEELPGRAAALEEQGKTVMVLIADGTVRGMLAVRDEPRPDSAAALRALSRLAVRPIMLTGDNRRTGVAIGDALGLEVQAELLPHDKLTAIESLRRNGPTAMVGDGINDAPALAAADIGIAMGGGTEVALETADAALLKDRLSGIHELIALARATMRNVRQNIAVALGFKAVFLVTSLTGVTGLWMAILADTGATVLVTLNALSLLRFAPGDGWKRYS